MRNVIKKLALAFPPIRKVHTDLENRRRRVKELEGHLQVLKKQMARALNSSSFATLSESTAASDMKYIKSERDKALKQTKLATSKYDDLYREFCVLSMSNEALLKTNDALMNGELETKHKPLFNKDKNRNTTAKKVPAPKKATLRKVTSKKATPKKAAPTKATGGARRPKAASKARKA